ncbi:hypothetical protein HMPREF0027_0356 [Actinobacillus ureae ATCC 25976]|uniref:Uncharacterized protein n=1 Tax=Actinobacillus ureae ATCC 25976 TaxID=887324 RepID=E8KET9_9PAST|nr:hypothetical protein HMPREF0027_0356 [Actinobacillus ureae ATCC 25976]
MYSTENNISRNSLIPKRYKRFKISENLQKFGKFDRLLFEY